MEARRQARWQSAGRANRYSYEQWTRAILRGIDAAGYKLTPKAPGDVPAADGRGPVVAIEGPEVEP